MVTIAQIYDWFMTSKKPTQAQFWASWGSFWNKLEQIPQSAIAGLTAVLNAKAEKAQFDAHKTDAAAHAGLFDTKEDKTQKGVAGGYVPLDEFIKISNEYLTIVNDFVTGGATSLASAETVKTLKTQIDGIQLLLNADDVNLDTVQERIDMLKEIQLTLDTILVNDYTTGGTTKALTAEMGKILKGLIDALTTVVGNKVDKVAGERLINAAEITKLAGLGSITTTVKPILSTALATQNVAGFVTYINALNPVLVVGASEIVKYNLTDTGRVFELNLRNRSFGVGQPAIVAADVLEITEFLNKDLKFSNYPNTRNDGQLPTNRVLSTDANGNLKMYTIATAPAPYMEILIPDSTLPSTTTNFTIKGAFFTPTMTVVIAGQTVNYITFVSDNLIKVNVTTGATEGSYSVTLNNGLSATFNNALFIVLGTVFTPTNSNYFNITQPLDIVNGLPQVKTFGALGTAELDFVLDKTKNFSVRFQFKKSPFGTPPDYPTSCKIDFIDAVTLALITTADVRRGIYGTQWTIPAEGYETYYTAGPYGSYVDMVKDINELRYTGGVLYIYQNNVLKHTFTTNINLVNNLKVKFSLLYTDLEFFKYIVLAS